MAKRHVVPSRGGGWDVKAPGRGRASSHHKTQSDAILRALTLPGVRSRINEIVTAAIGNEPCVVLSHSLGTVVAYNVLYKRAATPQSVGFVTVGSPLGIKAIKEQIERPLQSPGCVTHWFNAYDDRDLVALVALDARNFGVTPPIENKADVKNFTDNRHGIAGYLADPAVARKVAEALS